MTFLDKFSSLPRFRSLLPLKSFESFCVRSTKESDENHVGFRETLSTRCLTYEYRPSAVSMAQTVAQQWTRRRSKRGGAPGR